MADSSYPNLVRVPRPVSSRTVDNIHVAGFWGLFLRGSLLISSSDGRNDEIVYQRSVRMPVDAVRFV